MSIPRDRELVSIYTQANDIARQCGRTLSSAHVLLSLYTVPNSAATFLEDRNITVDALLTSVRRLAAEDERIMERIQARCTRLAEGSNATAVDSLHLLAALIRESNSQAHTILEEAGANVSAIRASVMSYATGSRVMTRRQTTSVAAPAIAREAVEHAPSPIQIHPSLVSRRGAAPSLEEPSQSAAPTAVPAPVEVAETPRPPSPVISEEDARDQARTEARSTAARLAESLKKRRAEAAKQRKEVVQNAAPAPRMEKATPPVTPAVAPIEDEEEDTCGPRITIPPEPITPARKAAHNILQHDADLAQMYALNPEVYPHLTRFGRNLTEEAALGKIDAVVGRDREITQLIDILGKRRSNNPLLLGEAGVGKTAIVEGLATELVKLARQGVRLGRRAVIELEVGRILGGTHLRGSFAERLTAIKDEVKRANGDVIVFLDEIHVWMNAGAGGDGTDAAGELKTALARGHFPCIGATTHDEFKKFVESDPAFERRFQAVFVDEPDTETTLHILHGVRENYEQHHGVTYNEGALDAVVRLSQRFIHERRLPDKAIGVMDLAGSRASRESRLEVTRDHIAEIVAELAGIPAKRLTQQDRERFLHMEAFIGQRIIGHTDVVRSLSDVIRRNYAGFRSNRPMGSLLFLGPTGVGKTELVKALADFLFFDRDAMLRFDMSEFLEAHSVSRLIGAPPGYVGFERGGQLTEAVRRRPYQVVLFDEVEKAHPDVLNILLQLLDDGRLTDGRGRIVDFSNCVVIMTSNLGAKTLVESRNGQRIGFGGNEGAASQDAARESVITTARNHFPPELWNRIDERLVFLPLSRAEVARIAALQLGDSARRLLDESGIKLVMSDNVVPWLVANGGFDPAFGARPMRQTIERHIEGAVAKLILRSEATRGDTLFIDVHDNVLHVHPES